MARKAAYVRWPRPIGQNVIVLLEEFDKLVDEGYDDIIIITPDNRYVASIDDFLDYGHLDVTGDVEVRVLHRSFLGRA
jgi:hypothetical protein